MNAAFLALLLVPSAAFAAPPMKKAVEAGDAAKVAALLDQGADLNGTYGQADLTPLKLAVNARRPEIVKLLLDRGADANVRRNGTSALTLAAVNGDLAMVELLLARGAEVETRDLSWARGADREAIVARMKEASARQAAAAASAPSAAPSSSSAAAVAGPDAPSYRVGERPDDFALVVSVEKYMDAPAARFAGRDAEAVRRHLLALGWPSRNILVLEGERAGRAGLEKYLERWLPNNIADNGRLFFYFAGDGASDPKTGEAYLLPWDGDPAMLETTGYPLSRLYKALGARKVRSALAVIDAGFSGVGERTAGLPGQKEPNPKLDLSVRDLGDAVVLLAASAGEAAGTEGEHGLLTERFLMGLNGAGAGPGGAVTIKRLYEVLRPGVTAAAAANGRKQTPQLLTGTLGEGDLRLR